MENEIKNCPFCGGKANLSYKLKINEYDEHSTNGYSIKCLCETCGAKGKEFLSLEDPEDVDWDNMACRDAIKAWNTRYEENKQKQQSNPEISDIALKMAIGYVQTQFASGLENDDERFKEIDDKDLFYGMILGVYKYYNSLSIREALSETEEYDEE